MELYTLKMLRAKYNLTQRQAGARVLVSESTWRNWETFKTYPSADKIKLIEREFDVTYDQIRFSNPKITV